MAKKRKGDGTTKLIILMLIIGVSVLLLNVISYWAWAIFLLLFLSSSILFIKSLSTPNNLLIGNSEYEKAELDDVVNSIRQIEDRLIGIDREGSEITKRQDGRYDERSKVGKKLNAELSELLPKYEKLKERKTTLEQLPSQRLQMYIRHRTAPFIWIIATLTWYSIVWIDQNQPLAIARDISSFLSKITLLSDLILGNNVNYGPYLLGTIAGILLGYLLVAPAKLLLKNKIKKLA